MAEAAFVGACIEMPDTSPLVRGLPDFYWSQPVRGLRVAGFGEAGRREAAAPGRAQVAETLAALARPQGISWCDGPADARPRPPGPWLGAVAFDVERPLGPGWAGFAPARFVLPELLFWRERGRSHAAAFARAPAAGEADPAPALTQRLAAARDALLAPGRDVPGSSSSAAVRGPRIVPAAHAREDWTALVERGVARIREGALAKVVLARAVDVHAEGRVDLPGLLARLEERHPSCCVFLVRGEGGAVFLGATPETFCRLDAGRLQADALAGSSRPGGGEALLARGKELREHEWVVEHLVSGLGPLSESIERPPGPALRELANVVHLHTAIQARLRPGVGPAELVTALHPTPAVGGTPPVAALGFLAAHEGLARGLYAGLIGMVGPGRAELVVALRSMLLRGPEGRLFVGAGIVEGSSAEEEWAETEMKASALLEALDASR